MDASVHGFHSQRDLVVGLTFSRGHKSGFDFSVLKFFFSQISSQA